MKLRAFANKTKGNKLINLDEFLINLEKGIFLVGDGVSENVDPKYPHLDIRRNASSEAIANIMNDLEIKISSYENEISPEEMKGLIKRVIQGANSSLYEMPLKEVEQQRRDEANIIGVYKDITEEEKEIYLNSDPSKWGTTLTALIVNGNNAYIANIGDSRAYVLLKDEKTMNSTQDDSQAGYLTKSLGYKESIKFDVEKYSLTDIRKILLITDGVSGTVSEKDIGEILQNYDAQESVTTLLHKANYEPSEEIINKRCKNNPDRYDSIKHQLAGKDNSTAMVIEFLDDSEKPEENAELKRQISGLESHIQSMNEGFKELDEEKEATLYDLAEKDIEIQRLNNANTALTSQTNVYERRISALEDENKTLEEQLQKSIANTEKSEEIATESQRRIDTILAEFELKEKKYSSQIEQINNSFEQQKKHMDSYEQNMRESKSEIASYANHLNKISEGLNNLISRFFVSDDIYASSLKEFEKSNQDSAESGFRKILEINPNHAKAKFYLSIIKNDREEAEGIKQGDVRKTMYLKLDSLQNLLDNDGSNSSEILKRYDLLKRYAIETNEYPKIKKSLDMIDKDLINRFGGL